MTGGNFLHGRDSMADVAKALGIRRPIRSMRIDFDVESAVMVTVTFPMQESEAGEIAMALKKYRLKAIDEPEDIKAADGVKPVSLI